MNYKRYMLMPAVLLHAFGTVTLILVYLQNTSWPPPLGQHSNKKADISSFKEPQQTKSFENVFFLKIHKTGSTTFYNMLARYAVEKDLRWATYQVRPFEVAKYNPPDALMRRIVPKFNSNSSEKYNIIADHSIYQEKVLPQVLHSPFASIAFLRHPISHSRSYYSEIKILRLGNKERLKNSKNVFARALGFPNHLTASSTDDSFKRHFEHIKSRFFLGLTDDFLTSLVLLRHKYNLQWEDIIFLKLRKTKYKKANVDRDNKALLKSICDFSKLDCFIYFEIEKSLKEAAAAMGNDLREEVESLEGALIIVKSYCEKVFERIKETKNIDPGIWNMTELSINRTKWSPQFNVSPKTCAFMRIEERAIGSYFHLKQNKHLCKTIRRCPIMDGNVRGMNCHRWCRFSSLLDGMINDRAVYIWH